MLGLKLSKLMGLPNFGWAWELLDFLPSCETIEVDEFVLLFEGDGLGIRLALMLVAPVSKDNHVGVFMSFYELTN